MKYKNMKSIWQFRVLTLLTTVWERRQDDDAEEMEYIIKFLWRLKMLMTKFLMENGWNVIDSEIVLFRRSRYEI